GRNANIQNLFDRRNERSISANDISQRFVASFIYALPIGRKRQIGAGMNRVADAFVGGWQVNGIVSFQTGDPLALTTTNSSNSGNNVLRPNSTGKSAELPGSVKDRLNRYLDKIGRAH